MRESLSRLLLLVLLTTCVANAGTSAPATPPPTIAYCDLVSNPQAFDGQWIQVRGHVSFGFEDFSLYEPGCDKPLTRTVWLMYGGDEETPTIFCCGDHGKPKGNDISVRGQTVSLIRDAAMQSFIAKVAARRKRQVNGESCGASNCNFYNVSSNVIGFFVAAGGNPFRGYGHLGCCHLLVIHKVSSVVTERTPVPDDEGVFTCSKQTWQSEFPRPEHEMLDRQAANKKFLAQQMRQHGDAELVEIMQSTLSKYAAIDGRLIWISPDLTTTYSIPLSQTQSKKKRSKVTQSHGFVTVTRERCLAQPDARAQ